MLISSKSKRVPYVFHEVRDTYRHYAIIILGLVVHCILLTSVFDIYFQSPVLQGIAAVQPQFQAPAKRVVLFLSDGLRADKCFSARTPEGTWAAPFLRSVAEERGIWGISHTRVPTESRPGSVALVAGFYEDVSAITRGWKENPVDFDTVFNESRYSWCWGSPDTLLMFSKGQAGRFHVFVDHYSQLQVDFGSENPSSLDTWVLDRFKIFLYEAKRNESLAGILAQDKIAFFFHLLGADICGHSRKPWSQEYVATIGVVDSVVKEIETMLNEYYENDNRTAHIFTADHGMTDWGSHGSSDVEETETPLLAWGAGIRKPILHAMPSIAHGESYGRSLNHITRSDIRQADVAPLMSTLIGIPIPVNSVGVLPLGLLLCDGNGSFCLEALLTNARQLAAQFEKHRATKETNSFKLFFRPFSGLDSTHLSKRLSSLTASVHSNIQPNVVLASEITQLIDILLKGIHYFQTYDRISLCISVVLGFLGWMVYLLICLFETESFRVHHGLFWPSKNMTLMSSTSFVFILLGIMAMLFSYAQREPLTYIVYRVLPVVTWALVFCSDHSIPRARLLSAEFNTVLSWIKQVLVVLFGLELLIIAFFRREAVTVGLVLISVWLLCTRVRKTNRGLVIAWSLTSLVMATSSFMPPVGSWVSHNCVIIAGVLCLSVAISSNVIIWKTIQMGKKEFTFTFQIVLLVGTLINRISVAVQRSHGNSVDVLTCASSWFLLISSNLVPLFGSTSVLKRLFSLSLSLTSSFLLLSFSFEALLFIVFVFLVALWWVIEYYLMTPFSQRTSMRQLNFDAGYDSQSIVTRGFVLDDFRLAYFCLFFMMLAFFGMGNVANVNSFSLDSVFGFITVFSPFIMGTLLLCKILIPFLTVACCIRAIQVVRRQAATQLFYSILLLCDVMALHFFFMIKDEGSWLEIGISLGHFVTAVVTTIGFCVLYVLALFLTCAEFNLFHKFHIH